jgi:hypothetical protein
MAILCAKAHCKKLGMSDNYSNLPSATKSRKTEHAKDGSQTLLACGIGQTPMGYFKIY